MAPEIHPAQRAHASIAPFQRMSVVNVVHIRRRPFAGQFSIEGQFACLRDQMRRSGCSVEQFVVPYHSKGLLRRLLNCWSAWHRKADVYHVTGDIHYVTLFLPSDRTVLTIHDCDALERLSGMKRWLLRLFWFELPVRRARCVTVISAETKRQLQRHVRVPDGKITVIPNTVSPIYRPCLRAFNSEYPRILQIGTKHNKNLARLVEALRGLRCHLHIVGRLDDRQTHSLRAAEIDYSSACDLSHAQMYRSYCEADLVSFVSLNEGFGVPILEANAVGRPVVTSSVSSMPEVAGRAACLVNPYDVESIRDGFNRVIQQPAYRDRLIEEGFENVERFRVEAVAEQYMSLYQQLAGRPKSPPATSRALVSQA